MPNIRIPALTAYGNSFSRINYGNLINEVKARGVIDPDQLNTRTGSEDLETNSFEKEIRDFVLAQLGHPIVRVELADFQIKTAVDQAITKLYYHCPQWTKQYAVLSTDLNIGLYEIPTFILNNLEYVVYKKNLLSVPSQSGTLEFDFFIKYFQDNFLFSDFSVSDFYIMQMHLELVRKILGNDGTWEVVNGKYLQLNPPPSIQGEEVILEYRALDSNTMHPAYKSWIQRYCLAISKTILGRVRGKYKTLPGPGGGTTLDGEELQKEGKEEMLLLEKELDNEIEDIPLPVWM